MQLIAGQRIAGRIGAGVVLAVLVFGTGLSAPANGASGAPGGAAGAASGAVHGTGGVDHRPIGGQANAGGGRASRAISEGDCLNQGGKVSRTSDSCGGTHKQCETVSNDGKTLTVECVDAD
jgi:hypothetical protein